MASLLSSCEPQQRKDRNLDFFFARGCEACVLPPDTGREAFSLICVLPLCERLLLVALPRLRRLRFDTRWPIVSAGSLAVAPLKPVLEETFGFEGGTVSVELSASVVVFATACAMLLSNVVGARVSVGSVFIATSVSMQSRKAMRRPETPQPPLRAERCTSNDPAQS